MKNDTQNFLELTPVERRQLRAAKIRVKEIHHHPVTELQSILQVSKIRAMELYALSEFQSIPSVGIRFAYDLISMGYYSLEHLQGEDGAKLTDQYEKQTGAWVDPCVEDQFRLVVHKALHLDSRKNWWDFTAERKKFRATHGYPADRPKNPWFELPKYSQQRLPAAKKLETQDDLINRLKKAITFMKANIAEPLTLHQLAEASHLSSYHFLRSFKSAYSKTPFQYLTHLRLKHACKLLRDTELPVNAILLKCGFENESSFGRLFKREFGITAVGYREEKRRGGK